MSIPLRELGLVLLLMPAALGGASAFQRGVARFDAYLFDCRQFDEGVPRACTEEDMLVAWDVQLQIARDYGKPVPQQTASPGDITTLLAREPL